MVETAGHEENHRPVASHWQTWSQCCTPRPDRDSNSQHQWWYVLIAEEVLNPTTMQSRPQQPPK